MLEPLLDLLPAIVPTTAIVIFFYKRSKATNADISRLFHNMNETAMAEHFLEIELKRKFKKIEHLRNAEKSRDGIKNTIEAKNLPI